MYTLKSMSTLGNIKEYKISNCIEDIELILSH